MPARRELLQSLAIGTGAIATGCTAPSLSNGEKQPSPSDPQPPTFTADVDQQAIDDRATRLGAQLTNNQSTSLRVGFGPALLFTDNGATAELSWPDRLVLDPDSNVGPWDEPTQDQTGCWRFPADGFRPIQSILEWRELAPGEAVTETYLLYTVGSSGPCLPAGTYRFQDRGYLGDESHALVLTLSLIIDSKRQIRVGDESTGASVHRIRQR